MIKLRENNKLFNGRTFQELYFKGDYTMEDNKIMSVEENDELVQIEDLGESEGDAKCNTSLAIGLIAVGIGYAAGYVACKIAPKVKAGWNKLKDRAKERKLKKEKVIVFRSEDIADVESDEK